MEENKIKEIINNQNPSVEEKCQLMLEYLFGKTGEHISCQTPWGNISILASQKAGIIIKDFDLLDYFFECSKKYYNEFK